MFSLGFGEIMLLAFIALVFIGPEQLPEVAKAVARLINEWKRASSDLTGTLTKNISEDVVGHIEEKRKQSAYVHTEADANAISPEPPQENLSVEQLEFNLTEKPKNES